MTPNIPAPVAMFERALAALIAHDVDAYAACFAEHGVIEWPFATGEMPRRVAGRAAIAAHVGANLARSRAAGRALAGPFDVRAQAVTETCAVIEFTIETAPGSPRLAYVHIYELASDGRVAILRDYFSGSTQRLADGGRNLERVRALYAAIDSHDWAQLAPLLAPTLAVRSGGPAIDAGGWRAALVGMDAAFADGHHELDEVVVDGDRVVTRCRYVGTHTATNRRYEIPMMHIDRFEDGLLVDHYGITDASALPR